MSKKRTSRPNKMTSKEMDTVYDRCDSMLDDIRGLLPWVQALEESYVQQNLNDALEWIEEDDSQACGPCGTVDEDVFWCITHNWASWLKKDTTLSLELDTAMMSYLDVQQHYKLIESNIVENTTILLLESIPATPTTRAALMEYVHACMKHNCMIGSTTAKKGVESFTKVIRDHLMELKL